MQKIIIFIVGAVLFSCSFYTPVRAATLFFESSKESGALKVGVYIDTEGELVNAVGATIAFPSDKLLLKMIQDGNSIVNLWVEKPALIEKNVRLAGITPGGYRGSRGLITTLVFAEIGSGQATIKATDIQLLRNDGQGSTVESRNKQLTVTVASTSYMFSIDDVTPPELFTPIVYEDMLEKKWFISFLTQDKGTGVDHYEVAEANNATLVWKRATSPFEIAGKNQSWFVKAVDKNGNEQIVRYPLIEPKVAWSKVVFYGILALACLYLCFKVGKYIFRSRKQ